MVEMAWIEVSERGYVRDGVRYSAGSVLEVPAAALAGITEADPPHGRRVSREYAEAVRAGRDPEAEGIDPEAEDVPSYQPGVDATDSARELAETYELDLVEIEGTGESGRVLKGDVEAVLEDRGG